MRGAIAAEHRSRGPGQHDRMIDPVALALGIGADHEAAAGLGRRRESLLEGTVARFGLGLDVGCGKTRRQRGEFRQDQQLARFGARRGNQRRSVGPLRGRQRDRAHRRRGVAVGRAAMQRQQRHVEIGTAARELSGPLGIGFGRHDGGRKDAGEAGRQGFGRHHRRLHQLLALRRPDARTAIVVELAAGDRVGLDTAARGTHDPHAVLGAEVLDVGHGRMIAGRLGGRRARHHAIRHRVPGDDLGAAQGREAPILPVGIVVADQQRDAADRSLEHLDAGRAGREHLLVLRVQPVLAVLADDAVGPQQHRGVVGEAGRGIPLGNADTHVHAGALEDGQQRRRGLAGNGIEKGGELL